MPGRAGPRAPGRVAGASQQDTADPAARAYPEAVNHVQFRVRKEVRHGHECRVRPAVAQHREEPRREVKDHARAGGDIRDELLQRDELA